MYKDMLHMIIENRFLSVGALSDELYHKYLCLVLPIGGDEKEEQKPIIFRNDTQQQMMTVLDTIEQQLRDQYLKQNESLKKIADLQKIEEKENLILERLERLEQIQITMIG
jgi:hypothetical protein